MRCGNISAVTLLLTLLSGQVAALRKNYQSSVAIDHAEAQIESLVVSDDLLQSMVEADAEFWNFGELVDLVKDKAKSIVNNVKEVALDTFKGLKPIIEEKLKDFKKVLLEAKDKCLAAVVKIKDKLLAGAHELMETALKELPKFWAKLEGLRTKLGEARDAVVKQLMAGSLTGAADVMNQHMTILLEEADKAKGGLKQQLLESVNTLKTQAVGVVKKTLDEAKGDALNIFTDSMKDSTVLVNQLLGEVKAQLGKGAQNAVQAVTGGLGGLSGGGTQDKETTKLLNGLKDTLADKAAGLLSGLKNSTKSDADGTKALDALKDEAALAAKAAKDQKAAGSLLYFGLVEVPKDSLEKQLEELTESATDLKEATLQAAAMLTERVMDVSQVLGDRAGKLSHTPGKEKEGADYEKKLEALREAADTTAKATSAALEKLKDHTQIKALSLKHGLTLTGLDDETSALELARQKVDMARVKIMAASDVAMLKEIGTLKAKLFQLRGQEQEDAKAELANKEKNLDAIQQLAVDANQAASVQLQACAGRIAETRGALKEHVKKALGNAIGGSNDEAVAIDGLTLLKQQVSDVWLVAVDYGSHLRQALQVAQKDLKAEEGPDVAAGPVDIGVSDVGGKLFNAVVTSRSMALEEANRGLQRAFITPEETSCDLCVGPEVDVCCLEWLSGDAEVAVEAVAGIPLSKLRLRVRVDWEKDLEPDLVHYICDLKGMKPVQRAEFARNLRDKGVSKLNDLRESDATDVLPADASKVVKSILNADREHAAALAVKTGNTAKSLMDALGERLKNSLPNSSAADVLHSAAVDKALEWERLQQAQGIMEGDQLTERQLIDRHGLMRGMLISTQFKSETLDLAVQLDRYYSDDVLNTKVVLQPQESTTDFAQEATSKDEEAQQESVVKNFGFSAAQSSSKGNAVSAGVSGGYAGFTASLSTAVAWSNKNANSKATQKNNTQTSTSLKTENFYSKSRYILEPRQLLSIPMSMLAPTEELQDAYKALVKPELLETDAKGQKVFKKNAIDKDGRIAVDAQAAADFLYRFGSHICPRVMLGGWWRITSSVTSKTTTNDILVKQLATETIENTMERERSIEVKAGVGYGIGPAKVGVDVGYKNTDSSADKKKTNNSEGESQERKDARQSSVVEVSQEWKGGCSGMGPERWRESLKVERNSNWKLVDRYLDHCVGLWAFAPDDLQPAARGLCMEWATKIMGANVTVADNMCKYRALGLVTDALNQHKESLQRAMAAPIRMLQTGSCLTYEKGATKTETKTSVVNPPEERRAYSTVWVNDRKGDGHARSRLDSEQAWSAMISNQGQWMSIELDEEAAVDGVWVQARAAPSDQAVTKVSFEFSSDCKTWSPVDGGKEYDTNITPDQGNDKDLVQFAKPVKAKCIKIKVLAWRVHISMRAGLSVVRTTTTDKEVTTNTCTDADEHQWVWRDNMVAVLSDPEMCLTYSAAVDRPLTMEACGKFRGQKWKLNAFGALKSEFDDTCADAGYWKQEPIKMAACNMRATQTWYTKDPISGKMGMKPTPQAAAVQVLMDNSCMEYQLDGQVVMNKCNSMGRQRWYFDEGKLKAFADNKCLEKKSGQTAPVRVVDCVVASEAQRWSVMENGFWKNAQDNTCLDFNYVAVAGESAVRATTCGTFSNQQFYFEGERNRVSANPVTWKVRSGDLCNTVEAAQGRPPSVWLRTCAGIDAQKFTWQDGKFKALDGKCVDDLGSQIAVHDCHGGVNQQWFFEGELMKTRKNALCADYHTGLKYLYMSPCHGATNQRFYFDKA